MVEDLVSIIIPVYNGEMYLKETLTSCLNQSYSNIEILIVDDSSTDNSAAIAQEIGKEDSRIRYYRHEKNKGFCNNVNDGAARSNGDYILILGQDDMLPGNHIKSMLSVFENNKDIAMVNCGCDAINSEGEIIGSWFDVNKSELHVKDFVFSNALSSCGAIIRRSAFMKAGGFSIFEDDPNYGEWYLWIKILLIGKIVACKQSKALYRRHETNMTKTFNNRRNKIILEKYYNRCRKLAAKSGQLSIRDRIKVQLYMILRVLYARSYFADNIIIAVHRLKKKIVT